MSYKNSIKKELGDMWSLVNSQINKSCTAVSRFDQDLAREIVLFNERLNCYEFLIDSECELLLALHPDQNNLYSYIKAVLKTNRHLERIGDIAEDVAYEVIQSTEAYKPKLLADTKLIIAYTIIIRMLDTCLAAFENEDIDLAQLVLKRGKYLDEFIKDINNKITNSIKEQPAEIASIVRVLSILNQLERLAEQARYLARDIINFIESNSKELVIS